MYAKLNNEGTVAPIVSALKRLLVRSLISISNSIFHKKLNPNTLTPSNGFIDLITWQMPPLCITKILQKFRRKTWFLINDIKHRSMEDMAFIPNPELLMVYRVS